jgi:outer membrane protein assembly factor BamE (lipoprotein component of BamABCDE complex)
MTPVASWLGKMLACVLVAGALSGCAATYRNSGYVPSEEDLSGIAVGVDDRNSVAETVGRPVSQGVIADRAWYFVGTRWEYFAYRAPQQIDRQVVAISFDDRGTVRNIERFTLADGEVVPLNRRVTDSNIEGVSLIRQLLGNIGNIDAGNFLN